MATQQANIYERDATYLIHASSLTTAGLWIACEPYIRIASDISDGELVEAIRSAFGASRADVPHPKQHEWKVVGLELLTIAGVRSWKALARGTAYVHVAQTDGRITLTPTRNGGPRDGFVHLGDKQVILEAPAPGLLAATVREQLAVSRP